MKFYCKNCKSVFEPNGWHEYDTKSEECPLCIAGKLVVPIPDYETPAQYEKRTRKPFPDNGLVWVKLSYETEWVGNTLYGVQETSKKNWPDPVEHIVIADPPVPPPDGWKPDETI